MFKHGKPMSMAFLAALVSLNFIFRIFVFVAGTLKIFSIPSLVKLFSASITSERSFSAFLRMSPCSSADNNSSFWP